MDTGGGLLESLGLGGACPSIGDEPPHIIAGQALIALHAIYRLHGQLARLEGDHLELLLRKRWYKRYSYESFRDFAREELQTPYRTATRRVALSRLLRESPEFTAALDSGRLGPCQILALSRLRDAPDLPSWITIAQDCTVRELEQLVADHFEDLSVDGLETEADEPGRRVTFAAPVSATVVWEHGIEMARRVLGWEAPPFRCVEAVLAETSAELLGDERNPSPLIPPRESNLPPSVHAPERELQLSDDVHYPPPVAIFRPQVTRFPRAISRRRSRCATRPPSPKYSRSRALSLRR